VYRECKRGRLPVGEKEGNIRQEKNFEYLFGKEIIVQICLR
jgi:hypothetical protein